MENNNSNVSVSLKANYLICVNAFGEAQVSFSLPAHDWLKLEQSEVMKALDEYLVEVQKIGTTTFLPGQPVVVEKVVYRNHLVDVFHFLRDKMIALYNVLFHRGKNCH